MATQDRTLTSREDRMHSLQDLLPTEQVKQGDQLLKVAAELLEQRKGFTDEDNYMMARGLLTM